ncbi:stress response protein NST1-like [Rana temporaria]|uniref:stress response protein NST1-like n=1 Tax=Rana temporaria TaxID=8407 RepID=UPI001AAD05A2|nr:stress response protein NST1-like [Rana temporaria]
MFGSRYIYSYICVEPISHIPLSFFIIRTIMHKVSAHRLINKVPSTCPEEMRNRIPARAMEEKEEEGVQMQHCEKKVVKKKSLFRSFLKLFRRDKTSESSETTKMITPEPKEVAQQKKTEEKEMEEKKLEMEEEKKVEKEKTNTFTEEEKRKVEEEVEGKKKNERKVKAMRDRIQRVKLYTKMTDTEDPEEKRKLMQQVIAHRMINKIGVPCAGQRRNSIPARTSELEEKDIQHFNNISHWSNSFTEEEKEVQNENLIRDKTSKRKKITIIITLEPKEVAQQKKTEEKEMEEKKLEMEEEKKMEKEKTNTFTEEETRKVEEEVEGKKKNERKVKAMRDSKQRVKLYKKMTDNEDPEEKRILCTEVVREEKNKVQITIERETQV